MAETRINNYEGMFVIGQAAAADFGGAVAHVRQNIEKHGGKIIAMKKWDERRLAYEIDKQKRAVYILVYFAIDTKAMGEIERSFNLSEVVMRHLLIKADHLTVEEMQAADAQKELEVEARMRASGQQPPVTPAVTAPISAAAEAEAEV